MKTCSQYIIAHLPDVTGIVYNITETCDILGLFFYAKIIQSILEFANSYIENIFVIYTGFKKTNVVDIRILCDLFIYAVCRNRLTQMDNICVLLMNLALKLCGIQY